ncbi:hypothetical protein [Pseudoalteromonas aurantia]|uniref:Uncharacterized protein n=1 Tax=Pseudoalteromonas aurantia TaxID=43654 RepID=A0A5S3VB93_9GAMM|nr:hypothetical protein [Pseudoalteromonas aurantia]TMO64224.1 hypothetical protein CWC18_06825 [Pseudoalteromonas aurantia]TMO69262.1 hypothetical protein CWC19_05965 [Pseudoalteromonas aurantia]TMO76716.1 hypothetical protein CWC20_05405 [Pseudoalteromonas aurantia]
MFYIKWLLRISAWLLVLIAIAWFGVRFSLWLQSAEPMAQRSDKETRSNVHWLQQDKPLIYNFSPSRTYNLRVLSNAIFAQQVAFDEPINYAIEYTLFDQNNVELISKVYHHASKLALDADQQQVKQIIENKAALSVSSGQSFYISSEQLTHASRIALRVIPEDAALKGVVVRLHAKTPTDTEDMNSAWLKLPVEWRERTIAYHTIGVNAITTQEIHNAVTFDWLKLAPQGVPDIDFKADTLYETLPYHVLNYDFGAQQLDLDSFYTDNRLSASFRVYEPGDITTRIIGNSDDVSITWYDLKQQQAPKSLSFNKLAPADTYRFSDVAPGLIVITSATPVQSSWFLSDSTPVSPSHSYYYQVDESLSAHYLVTPNSDVNLQFRGAPNSHVSVSLYDKNKQLITTHALQLKGGHALFDRVITPDTLRNITTDAERFYLRIPKGSAFLSIHSKHDIGVKLQSREQQFHYQVALCGTLCQTDSSIFTEVGAWFSQQAENDFSFTEQQRLLNVRLFESPPETDIEQTYYYGTDLTAILPRSNTALVKSEPKYFQPAEPPKDFHFSAITSLKDIILPEASLLAKSRLLIISDTPPFYSEYPLEQLAQNVKITSQAMNAKLYTNLGRHREWVKQRLFRLKKGTPLTLRFNERPESVVIKTYLDKAQSDPVTINTRLQGILSDQVTDEYTILQKRYALIDANKDSVFLLHPAQTTLFSYPTMTVPINNDLKVLEKLTIQAEQDIWISVLKETTEQQKQANWWLYETN